MAYCESCSDHVHPEASAHTVSLLAPGLKEETRKELEQNKRQVAQIEMIMKERERLCKDFKNELKLRDRHIRSTTVELQTLLKQMAMTLIKQMEASVSEVHSQINSQITSLASDASRAKKIIEDVEGYLKLEDDQFLDSDFKCAKSNLEELLANCVPHDVPSTDVFDMCIDYDPVFSCISGLKFEHNKVEEDLEMLSPTLFEEIEIEVLVGSTLNKNGVYYVLQLPTTETVTKLRIISSTIRKEFMSDPSWLTFKQSAVEPSVGTAVYVLFGNWYRGVVEEVRQNRYSVRFIDYGNLISVDADVLLPVKSSLFQKCAPQAFQCCLFDHLETENIPLEAKWYFGDCIKGSMAKCKLHKALTNQDSGTVWHSTLFVKPTAGSSLLNLNQEILNKIAEAASNKDSIRCRDIRYKNEDLNRSRFVEAQTNPSECSLDVATSVLSTAASDIGFVDTKPTLSNSVASLSKQSESLPSTSDPAKIPELFGSVLLNNTDQSVGEDGASRYQGLRREDYDKPASAKKEYSVIQCHECKTYGHISRNCPVKAASNSHREPMRKQIQCYTCQEFGHGKSECPKCPNRRGSVSSVSGYGDYCNNSEREMSSSTSQALTLSQPVQSVPGSVLHSKIPPMVLSEFLNSIPVIRPVDSLNTAQQFQENWPAISASMTKRDSVELHSLPSMQIQAESLHYSNAGSVSFPHVDLSKPPPLPFRVPPASFPLQPLPPNVDVNVHAMQSDQHSLQNVYSSLELYQQSPPSISSVMPIQSMSPLLMNTDLTVNQRSSLLSQSSDSQAHNSGSYDRLSNVVRRPLSASYGNAMPSSLVNTSPYCDGVWRSGENSDVPNAAFLEQHRLMSTTQPAMVPSSYALPSQFTGGLDMSRPPPFEALDSRRRSLQNLSVGELVSSGELADTNMAMQKTSFPMLNTYAHQEMSFIQEQFQPRNNKLGGDVPANFKDYTQAMIASRFQSQIDEQLYGRAQLVNCMSSDQSGAPVLISNEDPTLNMMSTFSNGRRIRSREEDQLREVTQILSDETLHYNDCEFQNQAFSSPDRILPFNIRSLVSSCNSGQLVAPDQYLGEYIQPTFVTKKCEGQPVVFQECERQPVVFGECERQPVVFQECDRQSVVFQECERQPQPVIFQKSGRQIDNDSQLDYGNTTVYSDLECPVMSDATSVLNVEVDMTRHASGVQDEANTCGLLVAQSRVMTNMSVEDQVYYVNSPLSNELGSSNVYLPPSPEDTADIYSFSIESAVAIEEQPVSSRPNTDEGMNLDSNGISDNCPTSSSKYEKGIDASEKATSQFQNELHTGLTDERCEMPTSSNVDCHQLQKDSKFCGRVTTGLKPNGDFMMQFERDASAEAHWVALNKSLMDLAKVSPHLQASHVHVGHTVLVKNSLMRGDNVARAQVMNFQNRKAEVRLIDYGQVTFAPLDTLYDLPSKLMDFPPQAVLCSVATCDCLFFSPHAQQIFAEKTKGLVVIANIFHKVCYPIETKYHVMLTDKNGFAINELLYAAPPPTIASVVHNDAQEKLEAENNIKYAAHSNHQSQVSDISQHGNEKLQYGSTPGHHSYGSSSHARRDCPNSASGIHVSFGDGGHTLRDSTQPKVESTSSRVGVQCFNCHEYGHFSRDCTQPKSDGNRMRNGGKGDQGERGGTGKISTDKHSAKGDGKGKNKSLKNSKGSGSNTVGGGGGGKRRN